MVGVLAAQANREVALVSLDGREQSEVATVPVAAPKEPEPPRVRSTLFDDDDEQDEAGDQDEPDEPPPPAKPSLFRPPAPAPLPAMPAPPPAAPTPISSAQSTSERLSAWRERMHETPAASGRMSSERRPTWRDRAGTWYRAVAAGSAVREAPASNAIAQLLARFDLAPELQPALALLYGAHLAGGGAAPIDVARVLDRNWAEALGRGQLAERGIAIYRESRVYLAPAIQRALDELPPTTGTLVGQPGPVSLLGPCAVVAPADISLAELAERFLGQVGSAILAGYEHAAVDAIVLEARAHGAVPMVRTPVADPAIIVAASERAADELGLPRID
jgi:hypothetical protein